MNYFVRSGSLSGFAGLVRELGQEPERLMREAGLSQAVLHSPDLYIPYVAMAELLQLAAWRCKAPDFGVRLGNRQGLEVLGPLGSCLCLQATVGDAMQLLRKNMDFHARGMLWEIDRRGSRFAIQLDFAFATEVDCEQLSALTLAVFTQGIAQLHNATQPPLDAALQMPRPANTEAYEQALLCSVRYGQSANLLSYPATLLEQPIAVEQRWRNHLTLQWRTAWSRRVPISLAQQVESAIDALLPTGECNLAMVAKLVEMHPRSLQQRLQAQGSSFAQTLKSARLRLAKHHLASPPIDLTTLALNLGFADLTAFSRAFKQWTGMSPRTWRQLAKAGEPERL
ncbi:AraC family transcriptional regulator [Pseudomonas vancouverensis]|uniref:AraC family transcriptional regulator n=1 Tax=Pseudomonas vancouverensis TaxID=95300 RepID=A0A1H2N429_PSEVA|nr:AraC family transcriptional regulator [Pseudomonas vancouverensis]KAB0495780.1 AraC family transcriptional regulator [Pseudomonas vancouverensis]TDB65582.1 AraC family transcriptional regulator [Pseudomonas vancouverensis]SDU99546.1 transcriptional regulator, AraC family [Pseudomonas vancouverensis]